MNAADIDTRIADEGRVPLVPLVHVHELPRGRSGHARRPREGHRRRSSIIRRSCRHSPIASTLADRSIVISGDTAPSDNLVKLARGADVLVHSAVYLPAVDRLVARVPNAAALKRSILAHQTSAEDAGRVAQAAGVKTLVLSHLYPPDDPEVTEQMWTEAARTHFRGTVIVGKDLLEV